MPGVVVMDVFFAMFVVFFAMFVFKSEAESIWKKVIRKITATISRLHNRSTAAFLIAL